MSSTDNFSQPSFTETLPSSTPVSPNVTEGFSNKTIIVILCIFILLILLNENIGNIFRNIAVMLYNFVLKILSLFGFVTGSAINVGANVAGNVARTGIDITEGTLHSVGNILTGEQGQQPIDLDKTLNNSTISQQNAQIPSPDSSENPIQNPISQGKNSWCLVGEYKGRRGCIEISEYDKCMSGQVYPSQKMCLNPVLSKNT